MPKGLYVLLLVLAVVAAPLAQAASEAITQLVFTTTPQNISANATSSKLTFQTRSATGSIEAVDELSRFSVSSNSGTGQFAEANVSTNECAGDLLWGIDSIGMATGTHSRSFCYRDTVPGDYILTVSPIGFDWTAATQAIEVLAGADDDPPVVSNLRAVAVGSTSATILWDRNEMTSSRLWYASGAPIVDNDPTIMPETISTEVALSGLSASTTYYFQVTAVAGTSTATTTLQSFTTLSASTATTTPPDSDDGDDDDDNEDEPRRRRGGGGRRIINRDRGEVLGAFTGTSTLSEADREAAIQVIRQLIEALRQLLALRLEQGMPTAPSIPGGVFDSKG